MIYRLAKETDIDTICFLVENAVKKMESQQIFQWDNLYPTKSDFLDDIKGFKCPQLYKYIKITKSPNYRF